MNWRTVWVLRQVLRADPSCHCISDLLDNFLEAFRSKYPASAAAAATISRTDLRVSVGEAGRPLPHGTPASVLHPGCDLFIRCSAKPTPSSPEAPTAPPSQAAQQNTQPPAPGTTPTSVLDALRQPLPDPIHKQLSDSSTQQPASASSATTDQHNVKQAAQKGPQGASAKQPAGPVAGDVLDGPQMGLVVRALWARAGQAQQLQSYRAASDMLRQVRHPGMTHETALVWVAVQRAFALALACRESGNVYCAQALLGRFVLIAMKTWKSRWPLAIQRKSIL